MLIFAANEGHLDIVEWLIQIKANVNDLSNVSLSKSYKFQQGESALLRAIYFNKLDVVKYLIKQGADMEVRSADDKTPLLTAISRNKPQIVKVLLENGAKLDFSTKNAYVKEGV